MPVVDKSVFISYRRSDQGLAIAIFKELRRRGFDVFIDFDGLGSGDFGRALLENIESRAHFVLLLTEHALNSCLDPEDWFRREVEHAFGTSRNIVSLLVPPFDFGAPAVRAVLAQVLTELPRRNGLLFPPTYFDPAIDRLCAQFLALPTQVPTRQPSQVAEVLARQAVANALSAPSQPLKEPAPVAELRILVVAHSPLASALLAVARHAFPETSCLAAIDISPEDSPNAREAQLQGALDRMGPGGLLVLTDAFGATPCNMVLAATAGRNCTILTGVNVPMLWRALSYVDQPLDDLTSGALRGSVQGTMQATRLLRPKP